MNQTKLKTLLENLLHEIENNHNLSIEEIINKLSLDIQSDLLVQEMG